MTNNSFETWFINYFHAHNLISIIVASLFLTFVRLVVVMSSAVIKYDLKTRESHKIIRFYILLFLLLLN
jgi:hypothetical protein